ncbi:MAG: hypothetical protein WAW36_19000 [Methylovulum miyakonense]|uniref:hypothetical protein n=1 Tax=Methylovulum miyakonense TaxID=645578 RepID=UPI003BB68A47
MAKTKQNITSNQLDIFQRLADETAIEAANATDLDIGPELQGALNTGIREAKKRGLSRERIVERMNLCLPDLEKPLTLRQLNAWTANSKEFSEFPARWLPAFCWACGCTLTIQVLAQATDHDLVDMREKIALELGQTLVQKAGLERKTRQLTQQLTGNDHV